MKKLTQKQKLFCKAYLANGYNATQAAITAGYSEANADKIGSNLVGKSRIKEEIEKHTQKIEEKLDITFEWKLKKLKQVVEYSEQGKTTKEGHINGQVIVSAIDQMNKMQGDHSGEKRTNYNINADADVERVKSEIAEQEEKIKKHKSEY